MLAFSVGALFAVLRSSCAALLLIVFITDHLWRVFPCLRETFILGDFFLLGLGSDQLLRCAYRVPRCTLFYAPSMFCARRH